MDTTDGYLWAPGASGGEKVTGRGVSDGGPDVYLDVPVLKVDEIDLDVEDLRARVSPQAEVLDLLKLNVGAEVTLGRVHLGISGVEAQAQLKVRLDNVPVIIDRVLTTLDSNPEFLHELARDVGSAVRSRGPCVWSGPVWARGGGPGAQVARRASWPSRCRRHRGAGVRGVRTTC
ncbi:hypothetical protein [Streptomyces sp. NPDC096032]|uniref:hypothetical protein n=1 Tax=Streptomyces sp. NPDC096032 TaxID=3366070 RepID=UPI00380B2557